MTVQEIADTLNNCAHSRCEKCPYYSWMEQCGVKYCQNRLITDLGQECRKLAEEIKNGDI